MTNPCILGKHEHLDPLVNLYVFPHSGGLPGMYIRMKRDLDNVNVFGVQYPARGSRIDEPPCRTVDQLVDDVLAHAEFTPPYVLLGHSLGAIVAYETAVRLAQSDEQPCGLIVSAMSSPTHPLIEPGSSQLSSAELLEALRTIHPNTLADLESVPELREMFLDMLRNDMIAAETYVLKPRSPLPVPIVFMGGMDDVISDQERDGWRNFTSAGFEAHLFPGGHFYFQENPAMFFESLNLILDRLCRVTNVGVFHER
jgi:surfactin synthase thioesterase subunit